MIYAALTSTKLFPVVQIILGGLTALRYLVAGDIRHTIYWACAAILTATVTF